MMTHLTDVDSLSRRTPGTSSASLLQIESCSRREHRRLLQTASDPAPCTPYEEVRRSRSLRSTRRANSPTKASSSTHSTRHARTSSGDTTISAGLPLGAGRAGCSVANPPPLGVRSGGVRSGRAVRGPAASAPLDGAPLDGAASARATVSAPAGGALPASRGWSPPEVGAPPASSTGGARESVALLARRSTRAAIALCSSTSWNQSPRISVPRVRDRKIRYRSTTSVSKSASIACTRLVVDARLSTMSAYFEQAEDGSEQGERRLASRSATNSGPSTSPRAHSRRRS
mmetsp:Transcript_17447/g.70107  ORF Transcript_17447/g.70107 Transcript_17447/m.70107 type:complete len:287 (-) Transcript_17447:254-1114(-)